MLEKLKCRLFGHKSKWIPHVERDFDDMETIPCYELECSRCGAKGGYIRDRGGKLTKGHFEILRNIPKHQEKTYETPNR